MPQRPPDIEPKILTGDLDEELLHAYLAAGELAVDTEGSARLLDLATVRAGLADLRLRQGRAEEAMGLWRMVVDEAARHVRPPCAVQWLRLHCDGLLGLGRIEEARPQVERLLATGYREPELEALQSDVHWNVNREALD